ncbi:MAG: esterase [Fervidobacterium sp.]|nr:MULTISPECIES: alpha/beta hydrolase-fold protein [Fervidobacterium]NPU89287.1 esterase [Fervidobacterium sp.]QIV77800.1 esterase [Fervidobacterium pennivorans subsp. keratinolyticus]
MKWKLPGTFIKRGLLFVLFMVLGSFTTIFGFKVTFIVEVPTYTPFDDDIYIAGTFNNWNPGDPKHRLVRSGDTYTITLELSGPIEYKFTRGSWETVEKGQRGQEIPNRVLNVDRDMVVNITVNHWRDFVEKQQAGLRKTYTGNIKLIKDFYSPELGNKRDIIIYLPPDYETSNERYPVLYMHDGQNIFDASTSFSGVEWGADETAEDLIKKGLIRPIIIVGIYNTGAERMNEYSPWVDSNYGGGKGDSYAKFIVNTLKPYIDENFRTLSDRENTAIMGSSMGGLISLYIGFEYNDVFSKVGAMSPSVWFANRRLIDYIKSAEAKAFTMIYVDMGTAEGSNPEAHLNDARELYKVLITKENLDVMYVEDRGAPHSESAWARRLPEALLYFFGK